MQAIILKLHKSLRQNVSLENYPRRLIEENRWRAARYGISSKLIDFNHKREVEERDLVRDMLAFIADEICELDSAREVMHIDRILNEGTGADRQLAVWEQKQDFKAVVDHIIAETCEGLPK